MQTPPFIPFRNIQTLQDLAIADQPVRKGDRIEIDETPYYAEICLSVTVRCSEPDLFPTEDSVLVDASAREGYGWCMGITEHGYLFFEDHNPLPDERQRVCSHLPIHAAISMAEPFRIGLCMSSGAWLHRNTGYGEESSGARLRLFVAPASGGAISEIGGEDRIDRREMNPVPETLVIGRRADGTSGFTGEIERCAVYNTARLELFDHPERCSAEGVLPLVPGGSSFLPRWVDDQTLEVFSRPEFSATDSYWIFLELGAVPARCKRLQFWTKWVGGTNMTPTFFHSPDGRAWTRVAPSHVAMRMGDGRNFQVAFELTGALRDGGYLASCPPFRTQDRENLLEWAAQQPNTTVREIGQSVLGAPLHLIRVGTAPDGPERQGVVITCGQHSPSEIMDGHVLRPLLEQLLKRPALLARCTFYFVPTVNVDGQYYGGNGLNANQRNTNRHWMQNLEPETRACVDCFDEIKAAGQTMVLAIDMHAGGTFRNHVLMRMGVGEDVHMPDAVLDAQRQWEQLLETHAGLRHADGRVLTQQKLRATDYFHQVHGAVAFCLELSTCSYFHPATGRSKPFGQEAFGLLAEGFAGAFEERFGDSV